MSWKDPSCSRLEGSSPGSVTLVKVDTVVSIDRRNVQAGIAGGSSDRGVLEGGYPPGGNFLVHFCTGVASSGALPGCYRFFRVQLFQ